MIRVSYTVKCPTHPRYTGKVRSRTDCPACADLYQVTHAPGPVYSRSGLIMDKTVGE